MALAAVGAIVKPVMVTRPGGTAGKATADRAVTSGPATCVAVGGSVPRRLAAPEAKVKVRSGHSAPLPQGRSNARAAAAGPAGYLVGRSPVTGALADSEITLRAG